MKNKNNRRKKQQKTKADWAQNKKVCLNDRCKH